jgi:hypothetical protein
MAGGTTSARLLLCGVVCSGAFVRGEIIEDHDIAKSQRWYQDLLDVVLEAC